ncbi:Med18 protein-domain-containing protein [Dipodascopsis tothii]|uniref:Med18 protein-domain-containing protein n=1 Tax=Dipodascopsis tothii TaxID=44089 RepID=UPI0034CE0943
MQQLSLFAALPASKVLQVLSTFAALTGTKPLPYCRHEIVLTPGAAGGAETSRMHLVRDLEPLPGVEEHAGSWTLTVLNVPEASKRAVTSQQVHAARLAHGDVFAFVRGLGYVYAYDFLQRGRVVFYADAVVVTIYRVVPLAGDGDVLARAAAAAADDSAGLKTWMVHAYVNVLNANDQESMAAATEKLEALKWELRGLVDLAMPDRTVLDSRVSR